MENDLATTTKDYSTPIALFGIGTTPLGIFADNYRAYLRKRASRSNNPPAMPSLCYVPSFKSTLQEADVYLIETISVFLQVRALIPYNSAVVISDTTLLLSEVPHLDILDSEINMWKFRLHSVSYPAFESKRRKASSVTDKNVWINCQPEAIDRLGLVIEELSSGTLLSPVNSLSFQLSYSDKNAFRKLLSDYLQNKLAISDLYKNIKAMVAIAPGGETTLSKQSLSELNDILKKHGAIYQQAVSLSLAKKSPAKAIKGTEITSFEIKFLAKMVTSVTRVPRNKTVIKAHAANHFNFE